MISDKINPRLEKDHWKALDRIVPVIEGHTYVVFPLARVETPSNTWDIVESLEGYYLIMVSNLALV